MYLTLPLPVNKKWKHTIYYVPWDTAQPHVTVWRSTFPLIAMSLTCFQVPVEVHRDATFKELRVVLGRYMDAVPENVSQQSLLDFGH
jgi:ubiquitin carboxyl-terminal hydrolase 4/11/15